MNLTCKQTDFRLIPAVPVVKVRRMLDARLKDCVPSIPTTEPPNVLETPVPLILTKSWLTSSL